MVSRMCSFLVFFVLYQANESGSVERKNMKDQTIVGVSDQPTPSKEENETLSKGTILEASFNNDVYEMNFSNTVGLQRILERRKRSSDLNKSIQDTKMKREDEDLLELMIRIAETPEEWERIQHVLRKVSVEENKAKVTINQTNRTESSPPRSIILKNQMTTSNKEDNKIKGNTVGSSFPDRKVSKSVQYHNTSDTNNKLNEKFPILSKRKKVKTDSGWPNFSEIMRSRKKWKHQIKNKKDSIKLKIQDMKENSFELPYSKYNYTQELRGENAVSFVKETKQNTSSNINSTSSLLQGIRKNPQSSKAHDLPNTSIDSFNRSSRPNFQYHRVTSNPRDEHKSNAILAISVVRKNSVLPSTAPTVVFTKSPIEIKESEALLPWSHARHLHKIQEQLKSIANVKSRLRHHWQNKEHPHHQYQSRRHYLHPVTTDINGLNH